MKWQAERTGGKNRRRKHLRRKESSDTIALREVRTERFEIAARTGRLFLQEYTHLNWAPFVPGVALVGLEVGSIYMYRVGWNVNNGYMMQSICIMIALVFVGLLLYHETLTPRKIIGIIICLIGVVFINKSGQNTFAGKLTSVKEFVILKREIQKAAAKFSMPLFLRSMEVYYGRSITQGRASRRCAE